MSSTAKATRKPWGVEEDCALLQLTAKYGTQGNWPQIAQYMVERTGKQCRERYINHLNPDMKKTAWTIKEDTTIRQLFPELGHKWSQYMPSLPGRSDNAIKNRYHVISRFGIDCMSRSDSSIGSGNHHKRTAIEVSTSTDETDSQDIKSIKSSRSSDESYKEINQKRLRDLHSARDILDRKIKELEEGGSTLMSCPPSPSEMSTTFNEKELANEIANELGTELDGFDFMWTDNDKFLAKETESQRKAEIDELANMAFDFSCYDLSFE